MEKLVEVSQFLRNRAQFLIEGFYPNWNHVNWLMATANELDSLERAIRDYVLNGVCGERWGAEPPGEVCALPKGHGGLHEHEDGVLEKFGIRRDAGLPIQTKENSNDWKNLGMQDR